MTKTIRVAPEQLHTAGLQVDQHAEEVQAGHAASDARIEAAQTGWPSSAAAAMAAKAAKWRTVSAALHQRLAEHGAAFRSSGDAFAHTEDDNATTLADLGAEAPVT